MSSCGNKSRKVKKGEGKGVCSPPLEYGDRPWVRQGEFCMPFRLQSVEGGKKTSQICLP